MTHVFAPQPAAFSWGTDQRRLSGVTPLPTPTCVFGGFLSFPSAHSDPCEQLISPWVLLRYLVVGAYVGAATVGAFIAWYTHDVFMGIDLSKVCLRARTRGMSRSNPL